MVNQLQPRLVTFEEAAELLRIGRTKVYMLVKSGQLRSVHIGKCSRISLSEIDRFIGEISEVEQ